MKRKIFILLMIFILFFVVGIGFVYYKNEVMVPILGYHGILPHDLNEPNAQFTIDSEKFEEQLKILDKLGYKTLTLEEYYCWQQKKCKKPHKSILITFDDGYQNNYDYAFPLLKKYNMNAVVFYIGSNSNYEGNYYMNLETLTKSSEEYHNIEFASHTYNKHEDRSGEYEEVAEDILKMKEILDTKYIAYPHGDFTDDYIKALKDNDYIMAFTFGPGKEHRRSSLNDDPYKIPRLNISSDMPAWKFVLKIMFPI